MIKETVVDFDEKELKEVALVCLQGILASGKSSIVQVGEVNNLYAYSVEEGAIKVAKRFLEKLKEVQNGQAERK